MSDTPVPGENRPAIPVVPAPSGVPAAAQVPATAQPAGSANPVGSAATPEQAKAAEPAKATESANTTEPAKDAESAKPGESAKPRSSAVYVAYGVSGAIFLLYAIGWAITLFVGPSTAPDGVLNQIMAYLTVGLAIASGPLWFMGVFLLTRGRKPVIQVLWQLLGIALLAPWPFILGV